ncbi:MAG: hypothetical protein WBF13_03920 [Candidatus Zixiibacteriota bacterium]
MRRRAIMKMLGWGAIVFCVFVVLVIFVYRPWAINWGATDDEINRSMPGDEMLQNPTFSATRAVTIKAQPEEIWPWIVQYGYKKAGMYCYDWFDNDGAASAQRIVQEYQNLKVGDLIPLSAALYVKVTELNPNRSILWVFPEGSGPWTNSTWAWELYQEDAQHTRLLTHLRVRTESVISRVMLDFFEIVMMRKSMLGIKERAEGATSSPKSAVSDSSHGF